MTDKIYRRTTQSSPILKSNDGKKARKRNVILNFRVTEQERNLIERNQITLLKVVCIRKF